MKNFFNRFLILAIFGLSFSVLLPMTSVSASDNDPGYLNEKSEEFLVVAHRGASGYAPESTLAAYELAYELEADYLEMDIHLTKDGHVVVMHDNSLKRTTNAEEVYPNRDSWMLKDFTLKELKRLDVGSWFNEEYPEYAKDSYVGLKIATLNEVLDRFGKDANYYIETKSPQLYPGVEKKLLQVLNKHNLLESDKDSNKGKVLLQSFEKNSLLKLHDLNPNVPLVQLGKPTLSDENLKELKQYAVGVGPNHKQIDQEYVQTVRDHDLLIHPYTVNDSESMDKLFGWGVTGMFTNFPDVLSQVIAEHSSSDANEIKESVEQFDEQGEFESKQSVRALTIHLTAVHHYENEEKVDKVIKHMESFKLLLDHQKSNNEISDRAYNILKYNADELLQKWK